MRHETPARRGLVLVGYRGTGKTTVGRMLAERLGWEFADSDHEIEARTGQPVATIFAEQGEGAFREWEERVIADLTSRTGLVLATGGGAVIRESNRAALRSVGFVAWLTADPETLAKRLGRDAARLAARPALTAAGTLGEIADVLALRAPHYRAVSDLEIETAHRSCRQVADAVLRAFQGTGVGGPK